MSVVVGVVSAGLCHPEPDDAPNVSTDCCHHLSSHSESNLRLTARDSQWLLRHEARCVPRCQNGALCRQSNRCVCRRGFHGNRCEVSSAVLTSSVPPSIVPHRELTFTSYRDARLAQRPAIRKTRVLSARSGPAVTVTPPAFMTTSKPKPAPETHNKQGDAKIPESAPEKSGQFRVKPETKAEDRGGVSKELLMQEENQASPKRPQVERRAERTQTPKFNNLQLQTGDSEEERGEVTAGITELKTQETPKLKSEAEEEEESHAFKTPKLESLSWSHTKGKMSLDLNETSKPEDKRLTQQSDSESEMVERLTASKIPNLEWRFKAEDRLNLELNAEPGEEYGLHLGSDPGQRSEKKVDDGGTGEEVEKKKKEEVKTGGAKKQPLSLREAQAVLLRKTLSRGGRGDKMAALLMKHIEKERKKVTVTSSFSSPNASSSSTSSSAVKTSVKTFYTQKGQYTIHVTAPSVCSQSGHELIDKQQQKQPASIPPKHHHGPLQCWGP
ncbi:uncharacterized protein LOC125888497 [Epinephelus fuscoguttatus]|uniref:uncharacterized protein LOC125888497 n=1 Tax=Epinephelus fuscoguttatus TaxID=293821 RepID=UPI0020D03EDE|nr:uncharacterized protein LOC125888497 [Epinephelus fuscoguttatus]